MDRKDFEFKFCSASYQDYLIAVPKVFVSFTNKYQRLVLTGKPDKEKKWLSDEDHYKNVHIALTSIDMNKIFTEAVVSLAKLIPIDDDQVDRIIISGVGAPRGLKLKEAMKIKEPAPILEKAIFGILEADKIIREYFPGYCLTKVEQ